MSNGAWLDGNATSGFRKCLEKEFSAIYVFNLRGNCRSSGDFRRREAGNVFGLGSRTPIAITLLVKNPATPVKKAVIHYRDIGDYLSREEKLKRISDYGTIVNPELGLQTLSPNIYGDWLNARDDKFATFIPLGDKDDKTAKTVFVPYYSCGVKTQRDAWCYNSSQSALEKNIRKTLAFYNQQREAYAEALAKDKSLKVESFLNFSSSHINWTRALKWDVEKHIEHKFESSSFRLGVYRPFFKQHIYFNKALNEMMYLTPRLFPTAGHENLVLCV